MNLPIQVPAIMRFGEQGDGLSLLSSALLPSTVICGPEGACTFQWMCPDTCSCGQCVNGNGGCNCPHSG